MRAASSARSRRWNSISDSRSARCRGNWGSSGADSVTLVDCGIAGAPRPAARASRVTNDAGSAAAESFGPGSGIGGRCAKLAMSMRTTSVMGTMPMAPAMVLGIGLLGRTSGAGRCRLTPRGSPMSSPAAASGRARLSEGVHHAMVNARQRELPARCTVFRVACITACTGAWVWKPVTHLALAPAARPSIAPQCEAAAARKTRNVTT